MKCAAGDTEGLLIMIWTLSATDITSAEHWSRRQGVDKMSAFMSPEEVVKAFLS